MYRRLIFKEILNRLSEPNLFIQVLVGPRQVGKTTLAQQIMATVNIPTHYASADEPTLKDLNWIEQEWLLARDKYKTSAGALLVLDEI